MARVKVTCPECGDVEITSRAVTIVINEKFSQFSYRCPGCKIIQLQDTNEQTVQILVEVGVPVHQLSPPREKLEGLPLDSALDDDALIDFHFGLKRSDFWEELLKA